MKNLIIDAMAAHGWVKDSITDCFTKSFDTFVGPNAGHASVWLLPDRVQDGYWITNGTFLSAGENVLAADILYLPLTATDVPTSIEAFVAQMESSIQDSYAVRMLNQPQPEMSTGESPLG